MKLASCQLFSLFSESMMKWVHELGTTYQVLHFIEVFKVFLSPVCREGIIFRSSVSPYVFYVSSFMTTQSLNDLMDFDE